MTKGVVIAAHGSRRVETEKTLDQITAQVQELTGVKNIELGFMEFSERTIDGALDKIAQAGCDEILVLPYFLFSGVHIFEDIPELLESWKAAHPNVEVTFGHTLGDDPRIASVVADQINDYVQG